MATITSFGFVRHLRADTSSHVLLYRDARLVRSGRGASFWFRPFATSVAEVPLDDRELALGFHGRSADFQDVVVQGAVTYRVSDPEQLATRVDFAIDTRTGALLRQPIEKLSATLAQLAQQHALASLQRAPLRELITEGPERVRAVIEQALAGSPLLDDLGLSLVSVRVASVKPTNEIERALEAPTRERLQEEADEAAFRRRALAVEKERAIAENELQNQIELARREQQLIEQRGQNARREAVEAAEAARIAAEAEAGRVRVGSEAEAGRVRVVEGAKVEAERARMETLQKVSPAVLAALAARELAGKLQRIEHLNVTPDLLGPLLGDLLAGGRRPTQGEVRR